LISFKVKQLHYYRQMLSYSYDQVLPLQRDQEDIRQKIF
jgi:hypothetical protein